MPALSRSLSLKLAINLLIKMLTRNVALQRWTEKLKTKTPKGKKTRYKFLNREANRSMRISMELRRTHTHNFLVDICGVNPICSKRLKSFTAFVPSGMESFFFPCQFNPIAFDILARDWLLFCFLYTAAAAAVDVVVAAASVAKAVIWASRYLPPSLCLSLSLSAFFFFSRLSLLICPSSYFALSCIIVHHPKSVLLSTFKISKLLTFHRQCHNTLNFSHFSVFVIFSVVFFSFFATPSLFRYFCLSWCVCAFLLLFYVLVGCINLTNILSIRLKNVHNKHKIKEQSRFFLCTTNANDGNENERGRERASERWSFGGKRNERKSSKH